ncbi:MAG: NfeD family protein [Gemmatimonadota bacterium]
MNGKWMRFFSFLLLLASVASPAAAQHKVVYRVQITGTIEGGLAPYTARGISEAEHAGAAAIILDINTPGGRIDAAETMVDAIRASAIPIYAFVNPRAYSAGAMVALATDGIYMMPGAVLGAATPVDGQGTKLAEKYVSAMRGEFRALAEEHGLDPRIAEAMVDDGLGVPGLLDKGKLLTLSTSEAVRVGYAKAQVESQSELLAAIGLSGAQVTTVEANWAESVVRFVTSPLVAPLLLSLGMLGLVFEIKAGAFGLGGVVSLLALGLFFGSHYLIGLAGWGEMILLVAGLLALALEVFVLPGFGVAGVVGLVLLAASVILALLGSQPTLGDITQALAVLFASLVFTFAVIFTWIRHLPNSTRFRGLLLQGGSPSAEGYVSALSRTDLVGQEAVALTDLRPSGTVILKGERIDAVTEGEYVRAGSRVRFIGAEGYRQVVRVVS